MGEVVVVTCFKVLCRHSPETTKENHEKYLLGQPVPRPRFEPDTFGTIFKHFGTELTFLVYTLHKTLVHRSETFINTLLFCKTPSKNSCHVQSLSSSSSSNLLTCFCSAASDVEGRSLCNHRRAYKFFTDSVSPRCHFPSFPCESYDKFLEGKCFPCNGDRRCGNMGYYADRSNGRGTLFLITREEEPFCGKQHLLM